VSFRLSVINPNSDRAVTEYLRAATARVLPDGSAVDAVDCPTSPPVIETALDDLLAAPMVVAAAARADDPDAFLIGCFGDPAVSALRELASAPVVGLGQAALIEASLVSCRFGVITTLDRGIPALWSQLAGAGLAGACAAIHSVESASGDPEPGEANSEDLLSRLTWQGRRLLTEGADGLVLACAGFGRYRERLAAALDVPVCDGIAVGACLAYGLAASGARTSKRGGYGWPDRDVTSVLTDWAAVTPSEPGTGP
jgi:allantoin racemase